jgi:butyrate kinase
MYKILAINPGSTSTKVALYEDETKLVQKNLEHTPEELGSGPIPGQKSYRMGRVLEFLAENNIKVSDLSVVVGRGGILPPVKSGAYLVDDTLIDVLTNRPVAPHASNLGGLIAAEIAKQAGVNAYIYDSIAVDELNEMAHLSGTPLITRTSHFHALNSRACAMYVANKLGKSYDEMNFIVVHMGGGISSSAHCKGVVIDVNCDDEGTFSPQRAGRVNGRELVDLCYSGRFTHKEMQKQLRGNGGAMAYLGTDDMRKVYDMVTSGDKFAETVYNAMAYQIAKDIGNLSTTMYGEVDRIILTGSVAYSDVFNGLIRDRVEWIAPVEVIPGEKEMDALAGGALRVLRGEEKYNVFTE